MSRIFSILFVCLFFFAPSIVHAEAIRSYDVQVTIQESGDLEVEETILYDFTSVAYSKHGIFRNIPVTYKNGGIYYGLRIKDIVVEDEKGNPRVFEKQKSGADLVLKIGEEDVFVRGPQEYGIDYRVQRAMEFQENEDILMWNVIGTGWQVPMENIRVQITVPEAVRKAGVVPLCTYGDAGAVTTCPNESQNGNSWYYAIPNLGPSQGVTILYRWPGGIIDRPSDFQLFLWFVQDNGFYALPIIALIVMSILWFKKGRDPKGKGTIITQFDAPDELSPALVGTIFDEKVHNKDVSAEIVHLAILGYLKIIRHEKKGMFGKATYELEQLKVGADLPYPHQQRLLRGLFEKGKNVKLDDLKNTFYKELESVKDEAYKTMVKKGYFAKHPEHVIGTYVGIGFAVAFLSGFVLDQGVMYGIAAGVIIGGIGFFMPAKTQVGVYAKEHAEGFKRYLGVAEKDRINFHNAPEKNPELFEKMLPYAMVFGVEEQWEKQFENIYDAKSARWYSGAQNIALASLVSDLGNFSSAVGGAMSSKPSSSSGGSVGGGFGGGGGGSW